MAERRQQRRRQSPRCRASAAASCCRGTGALNRILARSCAAEKVLRRWQRREMRPATPVLRSAIENGRRREKELVNDVSTHPTVIATIWVEGSARRTGPAARASGRRMTPGIRRNDHCCATALSAATPAHLRGGLIGAQGALAIMSPLCRGAIARPFRGFLPIFMRSDSSVVMKAPGRTRHHQPAGFRNRRLTRDYLAFERHRTTRVKYMKP